MKKAMLLAVCLILAGLLAVNSTFALPDMNDIFAKLVELLGAEQGLPTADYTKFDVSLVYGDDVQNVYLIPGGTVAREIAVANGENSSPAYFRLAIAVQKDALNYLELNISGDKYTWLDEWRDITIGEEDYMLMLATCQEELSADDTSEPVLLNISMDASVTTEKMNQINDDFLQVKVLAVDANAFKDAIDNHKIIPDDGQTLAEAVLDKALPIDSSDFNPF